VPEVLALRGRSALSPFRVAKLLAAYAALRTSHPVSDLSARYWHFVETALFTWLWSTPILILLDVSRRYRAWADKRNS